jgi:hypothetical protein
MSAHPQPARKCLCGKSFSVRKHNQIYCSEACHNKFKRYQNRATWADWWLGHINHLADGAFYTKGCKACELGSRGAKTLSEIASAKEYEAAQQSGKNRIDF